MLRTESQPASAARCVLRLNLNLNLNLCCDVHTAPGSSKFKGAAAWLSCLECFRWAWDGRERRAAVDRQCTPHRCPGIPPTLQTLTARMRCNDGQFIAQLLWLTALDLSGPCAGVESSELVCSVRHCTQLSVCR